MKNQVLIPVVFSLFIAIELLLDLPAIITAAPLDALQTLYAELQAHSLLYLNLSVLLLIFTFGCTTLAYRLYNKKLPLLPAYLLHYFGVIALWSTTYYSIHNTVPLLQWGVACIVFAFFLIGFHDNVTKSKEAQIHPINAISGYMTMNIVYISYLFYQNLYLTLFLFICLHLLYELCIKGIPRLLNGQR